jgi:hypothetical protein
MDRADPAEVLHTLASASAGHREGMQAELQAAADHIVQGMTEVKTVVVGTLAHTMVGE